MRSSTSSTWRSSGFDGAEPAATGRPAYHPGDAAQDLRLRLPEPHASRARRLEREAQRNLELMWLTGRLAPDFKTIADFRRDNGAAIRNVCREFVRAVPRAGAVRARRLVAIDGSKFKAVNNRDRNFTPRKLEARAWQQIEESIAALPRRTSIAPTATRRRVARARRVEHLQGEDRDAARSR
ncbi:MAG: transposase [Rhodopseudomonas palustris]|nr:transposase [Rhodopseudomonas palustris]